MYKLVIQKGELITLHLLCSFLGLTFLCFHHYFRHILFQKSADLPVFAIISHLCKRFSQHLKPKKSGNKIAMIAEIVATFACERCKILILKEFYKMLVIFITSFLLYFFERCIFIYQKDNSTPPQKKKNYHEAMQHNIQRYVW